MRLGSAILVLLAVGCSGSSGPKHFDTGGGLTGSVQTTGSSAGTGSSTSGSSGSSGTTGGLACSTPQGGAGNELDVYFNFPSGTCADHPDVVQVRARASNGASGLFAGCSAGTSQVVILGPVQPGNWGVDVEAFDSSGNILFEGTSTVAMPASNQSLAIDLQPGPASSRPCGMTP